MVRICFVHADGAVQEIEAEPDETLMAIARAKGVDGIVAECGGSMICGTCHVYVGEPWFSRLGPPDALEADMLDCGLHQKPTSRLACQIMVSDVMDGLEIGVPPSQR